MSLNRQSQMYLWVTETKNPIRGRCYHDCVYCYVKTSRVKKLYQGEPYLVGSFFKKGLGKDKTIFIGSCFDLFALSIPMIWDKRILAHCRKYPTNTYLLQSKNIKVMYQYEPYFPPKIIVGTTAETNRHTGKISNAPHPVERLTWLSQFFLLDKFISIEPIIDFDLDIFVSDIKRVFPKFVSIGADSKGHHLPEPPEGKIRELITELEKFTEVKLKKNLERLMK